MPIYKFKTCDAAEKSLWNFNPDEQYYDKISELWDFANELSSIKYPKGIFKFKNIEEANRHRDNIVIAHAKSLRMKRNNPLICTDN